MPARSAAGHGAPKGRPGQVPGQVGRRPRRALGGNPRVVRAGPRRARAGRAGQPLAVRGDQCSLSHSARSARWPSPGPPGSWESGCAARPTAQAHAPQTTPGSLEASAKTPRGTKIASVCSAGRRVPQTGEPTLPAPQRPAGCPYSWRDAGSPRRACGAQCVPGRAARTPGRLGSTTPRARPRGAPLGPRGRQRWPPAVSEPAPHVRFRCLARIIFGSQYGS